MKSEYPAAESEITKPPFVYEIRVKGRLSGEQWTDWFDGLSVSSRKGETTLRGEAADHAALYGLLARLRDLAIPLVSVKVLDGEAQRALARQGRGYDLAINLLLAGVYLALLGGLVTVTIFVTPVINTALALALLFAVLGGLAQGFWLYSGQPAWRWLTYLAWPAAIVSFVVFIPLSGIWPAPLGIGVLLFLIAGALVYALSYLRRRRRDLNALPPVSRVGSERQAPGLDSAEMRVAPDDPIRDGAVRER